ncbi:hypothetical protein CG51_11270 [Haematobacter missouriensis]|nr:acyltransferase family protein [Haematobacter missouriensis]KFI27093.1 hypothetical protein CG51_11270 [Haematobacter missouriensis]
MSQPFSPTDKTRIVWIDVVKGLTLFLVVLHHSHQYLAWAGVSTYTTYRLNNVIGLARMPLFFAISGYLAMSVIRRPLREVLSRRIMLFLHIFLVWTLITLAVEYFRLGILQGGPLPDIETMALRLVRSLYDPPGSLWFIWGLALYFLAARLIPQRGRLIGLGVSLILATFAFSQTYEFSYPHKAALSYAPFFLAFAFYGREIYSLILSNLRLFLGLALGMAIGGTAFIAAYGDSEGMGRGLLRLMAGIGAMVLLAALLSQAGAVSFLRGLGITLGQNSLKIYVIHSLLISLIVETYVWAAAGLPAFSLWAALPLALFATALSLWMARGLEALGAGWLFSLPKRPGRQVVSVVPAGQDTPTDRAGNAGPPATVLSQPTVR